MGLALSWLYQQIIAIHLMSGFGTEEQKTRYLPPMAKGSLTVSFACFRTETRGRGRSF